MSYTTILKLDIGKEFQEIKELRNSWGSAPVIWEIITKNYTSCPNWMICNDLWDKYKDLSIPKYQRAVLLMTFDRAYIKQENYKQASSDINQFISDFNIDNSHWPEIASIFDERSKLEKSNEGIGFHMTSCSDNPFEGEFDEETEKYTANWKDAFEIYDDLETIEQEKD